MEVLSTIVFARPAWSMKCIETELAHPGTASRDILPLACTHRRRIGSPYQTSMKLRPERRIETPVALRPRVSQSRVSAGSITAVISQT